jgi:thiol-disulfide isomerase/thioredoxin
MLDSFYYPALKVLDSISLAKALPKWYVEIETDDISCERDYYKFMQYRQRPWLYKDYTPKGDSLKNQIDLSCLKYYWLFSAHDLLGSFGPDKYDSLTQRYATKEILMQRCQDNIDEIKGRVSAEALSYFVANRFSLLFTKKKLLDLSTHEFSSYTQKIEEFIGKNAHLITDTVIYNFIIREKNKQFKEYMDINVLTVGDKAPDFYLEDINGQTVKLSDFRGKLVLLNFWGTYCAPCIKLIPEKNDMVNEFNQEDFGLVNISTDYNLKDSISYHINNSLQISNYKRNLISKGF